MQKITSYQSAEAIADELLERLEVGQAVEGNTWIIRRGNFTENSFDWDFTVSRRNTDDAPRGMSAGGLAHFVLFPERKAINDALEVIEAQLPVKEATMQTRQQQIVVETGGYAVADESLQELGGVFSCMLDELRAQEAYEGFISYLEKQWTKYKYSPEAQDLILREAEDALNNMAPEGFQFGLHPDYPGLWGFWPDTDEFNS